MPPLYHVRRQKSTSFAGAKKIRGNAEIGGEIACFFCAGLYNSATEKSAVFFRRGTAAWAAKAIMKDLTKGNPYKLILLFALPVFIGCVFQQLYNMADTIIVGNTVGADAFTGVGLTGPVTFLILGFVNGLTAGFSVKVAQAFGAGDEEGVRRATGMSYLLCILTAVVVTAVAVPLTGPLLTVMQTPAQYYDYAYSYLLIIFCGIGATVFYNIVAGLLRAVGDSRTPLVFLVLAALLNVGLDFWFILGFHMYYGGAALATVLSQLIAGGACLAFALWRYPVLRPKRAHFRWDSRLAAGHLAVGLPMALQFSITAIGCIIQQTALNGLDGSMPGVVTAYTAASKIDNVANQTLAALGTAMATFAGQNYGAKEYARIGKGVTAGMVYVLASSVLGFAFAVGLCEPLMKLFLNADLSANVAAHYAEVIAYGRQYLIWQCAFYPFLGAIHVYRNTLQGIGKSAVTTLAGVTELAGRVLASLVFAKLWGFTGICSSNPVAWVAAVVFLVTVYYVTMRRRDAAPRARVRRLPA